MLFQEKILDRYAQNKRTLPRRDTFDQYLVLVSEIMLQQTQVERVIPKYISFLKAFPSMVALAQASKEELLRNWSGLGFNSRALRLQQCAQYILFHQKGILPRERSVLQTMPGIGPYTSCSLLAFTYNLPAPAIDTNIRRIYIHELNLPESISPKELEEIALDQIPEGRSNDWHNALMDYGTCVLTTKKTGIKPRSTQSTFAGSRRQVRGNIIKHLIAHGPTSHDALHHLYPHKDFAIILENMKRDQLIHTQKGKIHIAH